MSTLKEIRDHVIDDLDLQEETFVTEADLDRWINEAIADAESEIHTLYEDYFLVEADPVTITLGQQFVDYPADIYANKIRKIIYTQSGAGNDTSAHEVKRVKNLVSAKERDLFVNDAVNPILEWSPSNSAANGRKIRLYPSNGRDGLLHIYYIRNAKRLSLDADECDIDEFERYITQYTKTQAYLKDGDPRAADSAGLEAKFKNDMTLTLSDMAPDNNDEVDMDLSHYEDSVGGL